MIGASLDDAENRVPNKIRKLRDLSALDLPGLDEFLDEPVVSINPSASVRQVQAELKTLMNRWKDKRKLPDVRPQPKKYREYLEIWDAREGFVGGVYERPAESTLREIAQSRRKNLTTIFNQYTSAFRLITGHPYSIGNWLTLFGMFKIHRVLGARGVAANRPLNERTVRDVPDSVVSPVEGKPFTDLAVNNAAYWSQLAMDTSLLIDEGKSDEEIVDELDLPHFAIVEFIRERGVDDLLQS